MMIWLALLGVFLASAVDADSTCEGFSGRSSSESAEGGAPAYEVLEAGEGFQLRRYPASWWSSTKGCDGAKMASFWRLAGYIGVKGAAKNEAQQKINMTAPVLMTTPNEAADECENPNKMSFWAPEEFQPEGALPKPDDDKIVNEKLDIGLVAVRCYTVKKPNFFRRVWNFIRDRAAKLEKNNLGKLRKALEKAGVAVAGKTTYAAGYNDPRDKTQHHEVWLPVQL